MLVIEQMWSELRGHQKKNSFPHTLQQILLVHVEWVQTNSKLVIMQVI